MTMRIAFNVLGDSKWRAGTVCMVNLLAALRQRFGRDVGLYLLEMGQGEALPAELTGWADDHLLYPWPKRWTLSWAFDGVMRRMLGADTNGARFLRRHHVDVQAFGFLRGRSPVPVIGWVPDFQHRHMPELFSPEDVRERDELAFRAARCAARVALLSEAVARDFAEFAPKHAHKARPIPPVSHVPEGTFDSCPMDVVVRYHLPDKFFYLPNQYWRHKNHEVVFRAMKILRDRGARVYVVSTGSTWDYRCPSHFPELLQKVARWGLRDQIAVLGSVPRPDVFALMRQCVCVMNPSLFEGFGLSVQEARCLGTPLLVSDLPAHREQNPPATTFFDPHDADALAGKMKDVWDGTQPGPNAELEAQARAEHPDRVRSFAEAFMSVVEEVAAAP